MAQMFDLDDHANSAAGWIALADRWIATSRAVSSDQPIQSWALAGFACECLLKARAMRILGLNQWPTREYCKNNKLEVLYTHNLGALAGVTNLTVTTEELIAAKWHLLMQWSRFHMYVEGKNMPDAVASDLVESICGPDGVYDWLKVRS